MSSVTDPRRLRSLLEAGIALNSELSLEAVLARIVETAAEVTGAEYAALGVIDRGGRELERFVTHGIDERTRAAIGELPRGRGILGALIRDARLLRLSDLNADPRAAGFPPNHPPMRSFLGVPIMLRGIAYGNLYLTEKVGGGEFAEEDEELVSLLAAQAAVAIENARLYEASQRWSRQLESLNEVGTAIAGELELDRLLDLVATRLRELLDARVVVIALPEPDAIRVVAAAGEDAEGLVNLTFDHARSKTARVLQRGRSERVDSILDDPEVDQAAARRLLARSGLYVPLLGREGAIGVMAAHDKRGPDTRFDEDDQRLAESFAGRAAVAVELSRRVAREALRRVVAGQEQERRRLALELHDETGQALTSVLLGLRALEDARDGAAMRRAASSLRELVVETLQDVRRLAVQLRPKALDDFGLVPALEHLAGGFTDQTGIRVDVESQLRGDRLPEEVETTLYRICQEALTNVVKHAAARRVSIVLLRRDGAATAVVEDDGQGFTPDVARADALGLEGMRERASLHGGTLTVETAPGAGTTIVAEVPLP